MSVLDELIAPDGDAVSHCSRCRCSVPLYEWELVGESFRHKGPLRDGDQTQFVIDDQSPEYDDAADQCGWLKRIPKAIS